MVNTPKTTKGNIFDDLGFSKNESSSLKIKAQLLSEILKIIEKRNLKQRELEKILDIPQPRVSELVTGKISKTSIEKLLKYLDRLGVETVVEIKHIERVA